MSYMRNSCWQRKRDVQSRPIQLTKEGEKMEIQKCVLCFKEIELSGHSDYEFDEDGDVWCSVCFAIESDTGETY